MRGGRGVVDGFVHADVEGLLAGTGMIDRCDDGFDEILDMDEVAAHGRAVGIQHQRHGAGLAILGGALRAHEIDPARAAEDVVAE